MRVRQQLNLPITVPGNYGWSSSVMRPVREYPTNIHIDKRTL